MLYLFDILFHPNTFVIPSICHVSSRSSLSKTTWSVCCRFLLCSSCFPSFLLSKTAFQFVCKPSPFVMFRINPLVGLLFQSELLPFAPSTWNWGLHSLITRYSAQHGPPGEPVPRLPVLSECFWLSGSDGVYTSSCQRRGQAGEEPDLTERLKVDKLDWWAVADLKLLLF